VFDRTFSDESKKNKLVCFVADENEAAEFGAIPIHQDIKVFASLLDDGASISYTPASPERKLYLHIIQNGGAVRVKTSDGREVTLSEGDAALIEKATTVELTGATVVSKKASELVLFDIGA